MAKPAVVAGVKKLVMDEKMFKKIDALVKAFDEGTKAMKKVAKGGPAPAVDPAKSVGELGALVAKSWGKLKEASGIKEVVPVVKKPVAKKAAAKPAAKKPAAKKPAAKKPAVKKVVAKPAPKPLLKS